MRNNKKFIAGVVIGMLMGGTFGALAASKTYQYTGEVKEVTAKQLSVDKGGEIWDFALDADSKGDLKGLKAGEKVTVTYRMFATKIEKK